MADIHQRKSGVYEFRRRVPLALQPVIGKKEIRQSLGTKSLAEARRARLRLETEIEELFAAAGREVTLSHQDIVALTALWFRRQLAALERDPPDETGIGAHIDALTASAESGKARAYMGGAVRELLDAEGVKHAALSSRNALADALFWASINLWNTLHQRLAGDYSPPTYLANAPQWRGVGATVSAGASESTFAALWTLWLNDRPRSERTAYQWGRRWAKLTEFIEHDDAARLKQADVWRWVDVLKGAGIAAATINNGYLGACRAVFQVAAKRGVVPANPFTGVSVSVDERVTASGKRRGFTDEEARRFLLAARERGGWVRWVCFVLAYTGARLEEVVGASAKDVREVDGVFILDLAEDRLLKNAGSVRPIPLHPALVAEGFVEYARSLPKAAPLFPDIGEDKFGRRSGTATKVLGRFLRLDVKIMDSRKVAAHSWRHRFVTLCNAAGVEVDARKAITGHMPGDVGSGYGEWPVKTLAELVVKIPNQCA